MPVYYDPNAVTDRVETLDELIAALERARDGLDGSVEVTASGAEVVEFEKRVDVSVFEGCDIDNSGVVIAPESMWVDDDELEGRR